MGGAVQLWKNNSAGQRGSMGTQQKKENGFGKPNTGTGLVTRNRAVISVESTVRSEQNEE